MRERLPFLRITTTRYSRAVRRGRKVVLSATSCCHNEVAHAAQVVAHPAGADDYTGTRMVYAVNGSAVTYVMGETWEWDGAGGCPTEGTYGITYAREFRYDGARQRYLNRELNPVALLTEQIVSLSEVWSDYDGDSIYGDFTVDSGTVTNERSFEPGIARSGVPSDPLATEYYHADHLGTTRLLSDNGGGAVTPSAFTAFGERVDGANHRYGYVGVDGYQTHDDLPFMHVGWRYYDPVAGRFLQRDPIGIEGGLNVYAYVSNTPTLGGDPLGLKFWSGKGRWGVIGVCLALAYGFTKDVIKPGIDRRNRRVDREGDPRFRRPFNPNDPWDWVKGTSWQRQRRKWREKHPGPRPQLNWPQPVPCGHPW